MNWENITFRERSQTHAIVWFCLYEMSKNGKSRETESTVVVARDGRGQMGNGQVSLWGDELSWNWIVVMVAQYCDCVAASEESGDTKLTEAGQSVSVQSQLMAGRRDRQMRCCPAEGPGPHRVASRGILQTLIQACKLSGPRVSSLLGLAISRTSGTSSFPQSQSEGWG